MGLTAAVVGTILFVAFALHAFLAALAVTERIHVWPAWRRCCALSQGRRWQTVCLIVASGLLGYGLLRVWLELGPERVASDIMAWLNIPVVVLLLALVAAIMGVLHQRLRQIEKRGSARVLAAHFD